MRANEFLTELGDNTAPYRVIPGLGTMKFRSDELDLNVYFYINDTTIDIEFSVNDIRSITGQGNAFKIFSAVSKILRQNLPRFLIPAIISVEFLADEDEPSRIKLYDRAVPLISAILGAGWTYAPYRSEDHKGSKIYIWARNNA